MDVNRPTPPPLPPLAYSYRDTAFMLGVSVFRVRGLIMRGYLDCVSRGQVSVASIIRFVAGPKGDTAAVVRKLSGVERTGQ